MAQQTGARSAMVIGFESTFGSAPATGMKMLFNTSSLKGTRPLNSPATLRGNRNPVMPFRGNMDVSGDIVVPVDSDAFGWWLKAMFGAPTTAGAGPYTHTYKVGDTQPSIAVEHQFLALDTPQYFLYEGCKVSTFAMEIGGDGELVATLSMVGATETIDTSSFDGTATEKAINRLHNFHASLTEGGSAFADATTVSLNVEFGLDTEQFVIGGGGVRGAIPEGVVVVSGQLTALFKDADHHREKHERKAGYRDSRIAVPAEQPGDFGAAGDFGHPGFPGVLRGRRGRVGDCCGVDEFH
ncbi:MAG: hypothetical protein JRJ54_13090 [Deltaproteobacteria bacterium]|nr:hypothetical protein [Deltaproteobacteria bacterium]